MTPYIFCTAALFFALGCLLGRFYRNAEMASLQDANERLHRKVSFIEGQRNRALAAYNAVATRVHQLVGE